MTSCQCLGASRSALACGRQTGWNAVSFKVFDWPFGMSPDLNSQWELRLMISRCAGADVCRAPSAGKSLPAVMQMQTAAARDRLRVPFHQAIPPNLKIFQASAIPPGISNN